MVQYRGIQSVTEMLLVEKLTKMYSTGGGGFAFLSLVKAL